VHDCSPTCSDASNPTLLEFTSTLILGFAQRGATDCFQRLCGVEGLTRGKGCSPDMPLLTVRRCRRAALIDWIAASVERRPRRQFGASSMAFTTLAAVKHRRPQLKAIIGVNEYSGHRLADGRLQTCRAAVAPRWRLIQSIKVQSVGTVVLVSNGPCPGCNLSTCPAPSTPNIADWKAVRRASLSYKPRDQRKKW